VADLCRHFKIPTGVIVNKSDLNPENASGIQRWCEETQTEFLAALPYDPAVTEAMVQRLSVTEYSADGLSLDIRRSWRRILELGSRRTTSFQDPSNLKGEFKK
jgi:MinD superfamily P-loop ATPase